MYTPDAISYIAKLKLVINLSRSSTFYSLYVPQAKARLVGTQLLFNSEKGMNGYFIAEESSSTLELNGIGRVLVEYEDVNHLPTALGKNSQDGFLEMNFAGVYK